MSRAGKGSVYERDICRLLSKWWTNGDRDDIFWRVGGSGGRAKRHGNMGKKLAFQHGDICPTDPVGFPLIRLFTVEIKRGGPRATISDLLDSPTGAAQQPLEAFLQQTIESAEQAESWSWLLIHKRDRREAVAYLPSYRWERIIESHVGGAIPLPRPRIELCCKFKMRTGDSKKREGQRRKFKHKHRPVNIVGFKLDDFLEVVSPKALRRLAKEVC